MNPSEETLEGNFTLDMPAGAILTGYGLDINGAIRDGVIVEKLQAERVFNERIRQRVDPGLAEVSRTNAFQTRVFPIMPGQTRQISVTFVTPVSDDQPYRLPLEAGEDTVNATITVDGDITLADVSMPGELEAEWDARNDRALLATENLPLNGDLLVTPASVEPVSVSRHSNGQHFVAIDLPSETASTPFSPASVRVLWDTSLSHEESSEQTLDFFSYLFFELRPFSLELVPFARGLRDSCLLYTSPSPRDRTTSRMPSSA